MSCLLQIDLLTLVSSPEQEVYYTSGENNDDREYKDDNRRSVVTGSREGW
jgi:hypothetical protein